MSILLEMKHISKSFLGVNALANVNFTLHKGEVHALMGENGAGKSTLLKVLTGVHQPEAGDILLEGSKINPRSPLDAQLLGISSVYQEINLCANMSVAENIMIGREPLGLFGIDKKALVAKAKETLSRLSLDIDVERPLDSYPVGVQQMVAITRALELKAKILILDEPTSSLDDKEVSALFKAIKLLKAEGLSIVFVTHFLDQVYEISDKITILRNGEHITTESVQDLPKMQLIQKMLGKEYEDLGNLSQQEDISAVQKGELVKVSDLGKKGYMNPVNFEIHKGEILGFVGLLGSGRTETARLIFGITKPDKGKLSINGKPTMFSRPIDPIRYRMGFCPEDRKREGIIADLSVRENIILALQARMGIFSALSRKKQNELADLYIKGLNIVTSSAEKPIKDLSGGNQQKALLARWLATDPELLILDEPTRGIDIGAKAEIQKLMVRLRGEGMSFIFISSEMEEIVRCSDKAIVFKDKNQIARISGSEINEKNILNIIAYGGGQK